MRKLHIDIETYSSVDITKSGAYKYVESIDFEILLLAFAFDQEPITVIDLTAGESLPEHFVEAMTAPEVEKHAHNAVFERLCFNAHGIQTEIAQWHCTAIKAAYCGLPLSLGELTKAMGLGDKGKLATGKALIRFFCCPIKPTKSNGQRVRNFPHHDTEKWGEFKKYVAMDVEAEREVSRRLGNHTIPTSERINYILDQEINDRGVEIDVDFARNAFDIYEKDKALMLSKMKQLTGLSNPNSPTQLKQWLGDATGKEITSLAKGELPKILEGVESDLVREVLDMRSRTSKASVKKYEAMLNCVCADSRAHGLLQFYGANRTGRWAGRLIQVQNLARNNMKSLDLARGTVKSGDYEKMGMLYDNIASVLSELIRTAFVAGEGYTFAVADFSAIEARVIAWLAGEKWRLDVFNTHGKIYEASAAMMFGVPIEDVTKDMRSKGKIGELALGYQGALGALKTMGGEKMGLSEAEMKSIVEKWREKNPNVVKLWYATEKAALRAVITRKPVVLREYKNLVFNVERKALTIMLPSGRKLFYQDPIIRENKFGREALRYLGVDQTTKQWVHIDTYGGKLVENIVQAIARDLLADSMVELDKNDFPIAMHVHDEAIAEVPIEGAEASLEKMCSIMGQENLWAKGLPLGADGYLTPYYKKD